MSNPGWPPNVIPEDLFLCISDFLSREDIGRMRLVNHEFSAKLASAMFRSVVVPFGPDMYSLSQEVPVPGTESGDDSTSLPSGPFEKYGDLIRKVGISFEVDEVTLRNLPTKQKMETTTTSWGTYSWPKAEYQRYCQLQMIEDTAHEVVRMKKAFGNLKNVTELGLTLNSGHGWLNGPDGSDYPRHFDEKPMVFGKSHQVTDVRKEREWNRHFLRAQAKRLLAKESPSSLSPEDLEQKQDSFLKAGKIYPYDSFRATDIYPPRFLKDGIIPPSPRLGDTRNMSRFALISLLASYKIFPDDPGPATRLDYLSSMLDPGADHARSCGKSRQITFGAPKPKYDPWYPLVYSGLNIAAGHEWAEEFQAAVQLGDRKLRPKKLTRAQIEWLRETAWAQKSFLTTYAVSVLECSDALLNVHSLHLSCIPSGLLEDIVRPDIFSEALQKLSHLTLMVSPDWRETMTSADAPLKLDPTQASEKFMQILDTIVSPVSRIKSLTIGFVGGGEHASGMFARNQLVMPAPLTSIRGCRESCDGRTKETVIVFPHVEKLRFKNCWFSPALLDHFLASSRKTPLKELIMDSCSLTAAPCREPWRERFFRKPDCPVVRMDDGLPYIRPGTWTDVINEYTPDLAIDEQDPGHVPASGEPRPRYLNRWEFISCGYVMLHPREAPSHNPFHHPLSTGHAPLAQFNLVLPDLDSMDPGLRHRCRQLKEVMLDDSKYPLLGTIVQCIGEDEEFILQNHFGMRFGWGDDLRRWRALDDGFYEGGTGRFSGVLVRQRSDGSIQ
ncbi:hypothetical protein VTN02DRAFT_4818 [Thermoascus thermophilus]